MILILDIFFRYINDWKQNLNLKKMAGQGSEMKQDMIFLTKGKSYLNLKQVQKGGAKIWGTSICTGTIVHYDVGDGRLGCIVVTCHQNVMSYILFCTSIQDFTYREDNFIVHIMVRLNMNSNRNSAPYQARRKSYYNMG